MSVQPNEQQQPEESGNPAWQDILNEVPTDLHGILTPKLQEWDRNVQQRLQDVHSQYEPYKQLVEDKIPAEFVFGALGLAQQFQADPNVVVQQAIETFGLDYVQKAAEQAQQQQFQQQQQQQYGDDFDLQQDDDITKHPAFQQMYQQIEQLTSKQQEQLQRQQQDEQATQFEQYMETLHEQHGNFDDVYVTALISQGIDGNEAVKRYNDLIAQHIVGQQQQQQQQQQANNTPTVMGSAGQTGSGMPENPVRMGDLKGSAVNDLVLQMINASENNGT